MNAFSANDIPWDLMTGALEDTLSAEEAQLFRHWCLQDPNNEAVFMRLKKLWESDLEGFRYYQMANEQLGWESLQNQLKSLPDQLSRVESRVVRPARFKVRRMIVKWAAAAAVVILAAGIGFWLRERNNGYLVYETALHENKKISLPDGSVIFLSQQTKIKISRQYNRTDRTIVMEKGAANFDVRHQEQLPFMVDLGTTIVKDIGTNFIIQRGKDSISLLVKSGKVAFVKYATQEVRELSAGMAITFHVPDSRFGEIRKVEINPLIQQSLLRFNDTPLPEVVAALEKVYGLKIELADSTIVTKSLTATLDGLPLDTVLKIITTSLDLHYTVKKGVYQLEGKNKKE